MADYFSTDFPQFSCALVEMRYSIGENSCGHVLKVVISDEKESKEKGKGKK